MWPLDFPANDVFNFNTFNTKCFADIFGIFATIAVANSMKKKPNSHKNSVFTKYF